MSAWSKQTTLTASSSLALASNLSLIFGWRRLSVFPGDSDSSTYSGILSVARARSFMAMMAEDRSGSIDLLRAQQHASSRISNAIF